MASKIRYNDEIIILAGKNKGKKGIVKKVISHEKVIIEGLNLVKKHQKSVPDKNQQGGIVTKEAPIHISNIAIYNSETNKADRVGFKFLEGKKVRFLKSTNTNINN